jgi:hypothetical protein
MLKRCVTEHWKLMDAEPEEWFEAKEQTLLEQHVLGSHKQFGGILQTISEVTRSTKSPVLMWLPTCKLQGCLVAANVNCLAARLIFFDKERFIT